MEVIAAHVGGPVQGFPCSLLPGTLSSRGPPFARVSDRSCLPTAANCRNRRNNGCTEFASLLVRPTNVPALKQRLPLTADCPDTGTAASSEHRGRQVINLTTDSRKRVDAGLTPRVEDASRALLR